MKVVRAQREHFTDFWQLTRELHAKTSPEMTWHVKNLASKRFNELAFGVQTP